MSNSLQIFFCRKVVFRGLARKANVLFILLIDPQFCFNGNLTYEDCSAKLENGLTNPPYRKRHYEFKSTSFIKNVGSLKLAQVAFVDQIGKVLNACFVLLCTETQNRNLALVNFSSAS